VGEVTTLDRATDGAELRWPSTRLGTRETGKKRKKSTTARREKTTKDNDGKGQQALHYDHLVRRRSQRAQSLRQRILLLLRYRILRRLEYRYRIRTLPLQLVLDLETRFVGDLGEEGINLIRGGGNGGVGREGAFEVAGLDVEVLELRLELVHDGRDLREDRVSEEWEESSGGKGRTRSRFMSAIARSMFLTTAVMLPVTCGLQKINESASSRKGREERTCRIVTAVSTLLATASIRLDSLNRFRLSFFFRIAFDA
jgi:hypothetical protein